MSNPPLNIDYWESLYPVFTNYSGRYEAAMNEPTVRDRAKQLWEWKGLNRSVPFSDISDLLQQFDWDGCLSKERKAAIEMLSAELQSAGIVSSGGLVTPAFLLHIAASGEQYATEYPIYDRRVWNAYVYLWGLRDPHQQLYTGASTDTTKYDNFCTAFSQTCPEGKAQSYERALFMFGRFIANLPSKGSQTTIATIDEHIKEQERALAEKSDEAGYFLAATERHSR